MNRLNNNKIFKLYISLIFILFVNININYAGEWVHDIYGWRYVENNAYLTNTGWWIAESSNPNIYYYYFDINGYTLNNTISPDGRLIDINGRRILNGVEETSSAIRFQPNPNIPYSNNNIIIPTGIPNTNNKYNNNYDIAPEDIDISTSIARSRFNRNIVDSQNEKITNVTSKRNNKKYTNSVELKTDGAYATVYSNNHSNIKGNVFINDNNSTYSYNLMIYVNYDLYTTLYLSGNGNLKSFNIDIDDDDLVTFKLNYRNTRGSNHRAYIVNQSLK